MAAEIGLSPGGLRYFVGGGEPYPATRRKLLAWYLARGGKKLDGGGNLEAAVGLVLAELPGPARAHAEPELVHLLAASFQAAKLAPPDWMKARLNG